MKTLGTRLRKARKLRELSQGALAKQTGTSPNQISMIENGQSGTSIRTILSFWTRGARSYLAGREETLGLNGDVRTSMFGADYAKGPVVAGLSLSHSQGLGEYTGVAAGQVLSSVTDLYPWLGYKATDRITVWGLGGYGAGGPLLTPHGGPALESGLAMKIAAGGDAG